MKAARAAGPVQPTRAEPLRAAQVTFSSCAHGTVYIGFHDAAGEVFAVAAMPAEMAVDASGSLLDAIQAAMQVRVTVVPETCGKPH